MIVSEWEAIHLVKFTKDEVQNTDELTGLIGIKHGTKWYLRKDVLLEATSYKEKYDLRDVKKIYSKKPIYQQLFNNKKKKNGL